MNEKENGMTVRDVLEDVKKNLGGISVPVSMLESVGMPIAQAINGIWLCIDAIDRSVIEEKKKEDDVVEGE